MANLLQDGIAHLTNTLADHASTSVRYSRGGASAMVRATFGKKLLKIDAGDGQVYLAWTDLDFCIPAVDLVLSGETVVPERGDEIRVETSAGVEIFEVAPYGGDAAWRWADPFQTMVRVHTKHVETEDGL